MQGLRIPGQLPAARRIRRALPLAAIFLMSLVIAGCLPEDGKDAKRGAEAVVVFQKTSEQVQRSRKSDSLFALAAAQRPQAQPPVVAMIPAETPAAPETPAAVEAAPEPQIARPLDKFHGALRALDEGTRKKPVTVLHLGDSHIASDRFTGDIRQALQARFGDAGRGLMMPGFPFKYYRARGVRFSKTGPWAASNSFRKAHGKYGVTGVRLTSHQKDSRLILTSEAGPFEWAEVAFLAAPGHGSAIVAVDGNGKIVKTGEGTPGIRRVRIDHKGTKLSVKVLGGGAVSVLSWSIGHNRPGVRYVNLGIPGATADTTRRWDVDFVHDDVAALDPDLIVLGFGTNEGFNDGLNIGGYEKRVTELTQRLLKAAPNASLAIIGPADGARLPRYARKRGSSVCKPLTDAERSSYRRLVRAGSGSLARWHPPPKLSEVRGALARIAEAQNAHFWDWAEMMGGACSIHEWARSKPKLALSDHVHISSEGGKRSAAAFVQSLMAGYDKGEKLASRADFLDSGESVSR